MSKIPRSSLNEVASNSLNDIRARMDARRNPTMVKPTASPAAPVAAQEPKYKVGDAVKFAVGRGIPNNGTITVMGPGPTQMTVKADNGKEYDLDTRMKSLYLQLAEPAQTDTPRPSLQRPSLQRPAAGVPDLPRATMSRGQNKTTGLPLIQYNGQSYSPPESPYTKAPEGITGTQVLVPAAAFGIRSMGDVIALLSNDGTAYAEQPIKVVNPMGRPSSSAPTKPSVVNANSNSGIAKGMNEAGEWKAEAEDFKEWSNHVKDSLLSVAASQRFAMAKKLSQIEAKHFGNAAQTGYNAQTGRPDSTSSPGLTTTVKHIYDAINDGKLTNATTPAATAAIASATQQTPFGTVTRPAGQLDPYHASPALAGGDRQAAQNQARPQQGGGSIKILRTEEDWEEALTNQDSGEGDTNTPAGFSSAMSKLPSWKVMLATIMLASKLPIIGDKVKNTIISSIKNEFGVQMSFKEALGYMQHVRTTPPEEIVSPAVWKFEKDGGDYETAIEELPDDEVNVRPAEVMSAIANNLISAGVAQEIKPEKEEKPSDGGAGAFGNMASQLTKKTEPVDEGQWFRTDYGWAGGSKPGGGTYKHPDTIKAERAAREKAKREAEAKKKSEQNVTEGMSDVHQDIGEIMDKHIGMYKNGRLDADRLMHLITKAARIIANRYKIDQNQAEQFVSNYVEDAAKESGLAEAKEEYGADYQDKVKRLGQMAKQGERKTVWDPVNRVYKTVPVNKSKEQGVAEGKDEKIAQLKKDHETAVHWSKNETSPQKREAARQKAEKIKRHLETQYKQDVAEGKKSDRYHIVDKDGKPASLASYADKAAAVKDRDEKYPGAVVQQVGSRGKVKGVAEGFDNTASATPAKNERGRFTALDDDEPMRLKCEDGEFRTIQEINVLRQKIGMKPFSIKSKQGIAEGYNGEYDDEAGMADNNLETLRRAVEGIDQVINPGDNLPEWCQEKIAVAKSMLVAVHDYMKSEQDNTIAEEKQGLWANIHAKRERIKHGYGERMRKPGSKGAPTAHVLKVSAEPAKKESSIMKGLQIEGSEQERHTGGGLGTPYPTTYEQETLPYRTRGQKRTQAIAFENKRTR